VVEDEAGSRPGAGEVSAEDRSFSLVRGGDAATLTFRRAPANVLDVDTLYALSAALSRIDDDPPRTLILAGEPHFCGGVAIDDHVPGKIDAMLAAIHGFVRALLAVPAVTVAQVSGACLGGGAEIALACDLVFAAEDARIGFPEIGLACFPPVAAILLPDAIGRSSAADWLLTGRIVSGREAVQSGFAARVVAPNRLGEEVERFVAELRTRSRGAVLESIAIVRAPKKALFESHIGAAEAAYRRLAGSPDLGRAVAAFMERKAK
jgi:cyclohexa-1,5-dienecarbonyl-CoA hydratase